MLLEGGDVLVQVKHALHHDLDLVVGEVGEGRPEQRRRELLYVQHVVGCGPQLAIDPARLHQREDICQDGGVHGEAGRVRRVRHHREHVLQDVRQVGLVEAGGSRLVLLHVLQQLEQDLEAGVGDVPHRVLERPDDAIQHQLELCGGDVEKGGKAVVVNRLEQQEEVCPVLGVLFEVLVDHLQGALEYRVEDLGDLQKKACAYYVPQKKITNKIY